MACKCQECGLEYKTDIVVPNSLWDGIKPVGKPKGAGLLCPQCIGKKIEAFGTYQAYRLEVI